MSISKNDLKAVKEKLSNTNKSVIRKSQISEAKKNAKRYNTNNHVKVKTLWNYKANDLVFMKIGSNREIGLIVSDYMYHTNKVEKNNFFVLLENRVIQVDGKYLRKA